METVIAYYKNGEGTFERYEMERIDYNDAKKRFPELWSLDKPAIDDKIEDKVPVKVNYATEIETQSAQPHASPPILKRQRVA